MRIGFVTASISRNGGGIFFSARSMAQHLNCPATGNTVEVQGLRDEFSSADAASWNPVRVYAHPTIGMKAIGYSPELLKGLEAGNYDLLHTHGIWQWPSAAVTSWQKQQANRRYVVSPHGMLDKWALNRSRLKKWIASSWYERKHLRSAACIHALCQAEADSIRAYGLTNPICIIPNGVDGLPDNPLKSRTKSSVKSLLFLGRIHPKKGLDLAIASWNKFTRKCGESKSNSRWRFVIAGWDQENYSAQLQKQCDSLGIRWLAMNIEEFLAQTIKDSHGGSDFVSENNASGPSIIFVGPAFGETKARLLREVDAFILPSHSEGLPMAVLEAWANGLPSLITPQCNLPEGFVDNRSIRIEPEIESIFDGMCRLGTLSEADCRQMGEKARDLVRKQFTWEYVTTELQAVYDWIIGGASCPASVRER